ncbi:MAG: GGDEF domain-containing protein [Dehalococcoidia bacterium]
MTRVDVQTIVQSPQLPTLPMVALEVINLARRTDASVEAVATVLSNDPALAGKVLRTANSSFYAQARTIHTIKQAVIVLGLNTVRTLALGFSLADTFRRGGNRGFDYTAYWQQCLLSAAGARVIAQRHTPALAEEAFLSGLLHHIGVLALAEAVGEDEQAFIVAAEGDPHALRALEQAELGLDHTEVGVALAEEWRLPPALVEALRSYLEPDQASIEARPLVRSVALGDDLARLYLHPDVGGSMRVIRTRAAEWFGLGEPEVDGVVNAVHEQASAMREMFDLPASGVAAPQAILAKANEALLELNLAAQREAATDALTGLANRREFDRSLASALAEGTPERPVAVVIADIDHFKRVNDTYGHPAGDRVLAAVADAVRNATRWGDVAARYGGEEFALILRGASPESAVEVAERMRTAVAEQSIDIEGVSVHVTISAGVALNGDGDPADVVLAQADVALYEAKSAGRNRVCMAAPELAA